MATAAAGAAAAVAEAARVMGTEVAAEVLDLSKAEVRRLSREAR